MNRGNAKVLAGIFVLGAALTLLPGQRTAQAAEKIVLKVALLIPRTPGVVMEEKRYNRRLAEKTNGQVQVRVYWGGVAGDERDVLRKMRSGQMDGSPLSLEVMSSFVRECLVLASPALFNNYKQVDAVRRELTPAFNEESFKNGFKVMGWADIGKLRIFSKKSITSLADFKRVRPWLYPESEMLKEFYKIIGATGVPLGIPEVYGAMQTGMIDTFWGTAALAGALQWHRTGKYISKDGLGFISGAFVFRRPAWEALPEAGRTAMLEMVKERQSEIQRDLRKSDVKAYKKLLSRGYTALAATDQSEWWAVGHKLRQRMIGRIYTKKLVQKAEKIAIKYADATQKKHWKH